jgi:hypothetical protein
MGSEGTQYLFPACLSSSSPPSPLAPYSPLIIPPQTRYHLALDTRPEIGLLASPPGMDLGPTAPPSYGYGMCDRVNHSILFLPVHLWLGIWHYTVVKSLNFHGAERIEIVLGHKTVSFWIWRDCLTRSLISDFSWNFSRSWSLVYNTEVSLPSALN